MNIALRGAGLGKPSPLKPTDFLYFTIVQRNNQMTDYRAFFKSKLVEVASKQADLEREREGILSALGLLDEADSESYPREDFTTEAYSHAWRNTG